MGLRIMARSLSSAFVRLSTAIRPKSSDVGAVFEHVGPRHEGDLLCRRQHARRILELHVPGQAPTAAAARTVQPGSRSAIDGPVADDAVGHPGGKGQAWPARPWSVKRFLRRTGRRSSSSSGSRWPGPGDWVRSSRSVRTCTDRRRRQSVSPASATAGLDGLGGQLEDARPPSRASTRCSRSRRWRLHLEETGLGCAIVRQAPCRVRSGR